MRNPRGEAAAPPTPWQLEPRPSLSESSRATASTREAFVERDFGWASSQSSWSLSVRVVQRAWDHSVCARSPARACRGAFAPRFARQRTRADAGAASLSRCASPYFFAVVTEIRLRPFARRRRRTARPPRVFLRARKPCVRLRLLLWGWYVRLDTANLQGNAERSGIDTRVRTPSQDFESPHPENVRSGPLSIRSGLLVGKARIPEFNWRRIPLAKGNRHLLPRPRFLLWTSR